MYLISSYDSNYPYSCSHFVICHFLNILLFNNLNVSRSTIKTQFKKNITNIFYFYFFETNTDTCLQFYFQGMSHIRRNYN